MNIMKKTILLLLLLPLIASSQQRTTIIKSAEPDYSSYFQDAYLQYPSIPLGVLEAVAYGNTHIYHNIHTEGEEGNCMGMPLSYGVMGLTLDGKNYFNNNLIYVSSLSGISTDLIINYPEKNILAYAGAFNSVMNSLASQKPADTKNSEIIFNTLIALSELPHADEGQTFALNSQLYSYFTFLNSTEFQVKYNFPNYNFDLQTLFGEDNYKVLSSAQVTVSDDGISDDQGNIYKSLGSGNNQSTQSADYPPAIWTAAASCNFSSRTQAVTAVVIHDVEGSYASCISWFQNCSAAVSAHYVVRSSDGQITQMVLESKKAWHVGSENGYTIGIEHEGYNTQTGWYTAAMYQSSANLVKDICASGYGINKTTCWSGASCNGICLLSSAYKIKGHQHYPNQSHNDPGVNWNWGTYYNLINNTSTSCGIPAGLTTSSITLNSAELNWAAVSGASSYNVKYKPTTSSTWTTVSSATVSKSISGLISSTAYEFQVQAVCTSVGSYSASTAFTTIPASGSNDYCGNSQTLIPNTTCVLTSGNTAGATPSGLPKASCDGFSGTPALNDVWYNFQATASVSTIKVTPSAGFDAVLALYTSCSGGQIGCSDNGGGPGAAETIIANALTVGTTYYIRVYSYGASVPSTTSFNICITSANTASCGTPTGLSASSITSAGAVLNWTAVSGAVSYNVQYKLSSSSSWTPVSSASASIAISGLSASSAYQFIVQAVCSSAGSYSSAAAFTTAAGTSTNSTVTIGTSTTPYSAHPFGTVYMDERVQYIFKKAELTSAGWSPSSPYLNSISFFVSSAAPQPMGSFKITMAHTTASAFSSTSFLTGSNSLEVYTGTISAVQGWNTYTFSTAFHYDGTSNLLMSICWDNSSFTVNSSVYANSYSNYVALYYRADLSSSGACSKTTGTQSYYRPNSRFEFSSVQASSMIYTPMELRSNITSSSPLNEPGFEIYPNPINGGILYGKFTNPENKKSTVKIYDLLGRELVSKEVNIEDGNFSMSFDYENFKAGTYMVVVLTDTVRLTKRVIIK